MNITEPGKITDRITLLGRHESCLQLVDGGDEAVLLGGSMSYVAPEVTEQIEALGIDEQKIKRLVILHSHFDHCGLIPYLKRRWPWATITGSARARELLARPRVSQTIGFMNQAAASRFEREQVVKELDAAFTRIDVEETVGDGDTISCGEVALEVIEVPGHSSCAIAVYLPDEKALFASDAAGVSTGEFFLSAGNSNYDRYQQSLEKMAAYDVEIVAREHFGVSTGAEGRGYLARSIEEAKRSRARLEEAYRQTGNKSKATDAIVDDLMATAPDNFLAREVITMVVGQMMKFIARQIDGE